MILKINILTILKESLQKEKMASGIITKVFLLILLVLITCTSNGQRLTSDTLTLEKPIDYSLFFGRHVKRMKEVTACAISKTDAQAFLLWRRGKQLTLPQYLPMHVTGYCPNLVPMRKKCSRIKLSRFRSTILSSLNRSKMGWTDPKQSWLIEYLLQSLLEENLPQVPKINLKNSRGSIQLSTGKIPVIIRMTEKN